MKRTRRHKLLQVSIFFLIYSIIHVVSDTSKQLNEHDSVDTNNKKNVENPTNNNSNNNKNGEVTTQASTGNDKNAGNAPITSTTKKPTIPSTTTATTTTTTTTTTTKPPTTKSVTTLKTTKSVTTLKTTTTSIVTSTATTRNSSGDGCVPPAIEQFPRPIIGPEGRKYGGIILFVIVAIYTFLGLAIVCDEYFVASLDRICEELKMSPDVAGATFMAAGSSAPELATVIIGVFFAKDDIGISGVIGSAVFNIMFVISLCALCTPTVIHLNWWPLVRDCFFYALSIFAMLLVITDEYISWPESLFMLIMYVIYCITLHFNPILERWAQTLPVPCKNVSPDEQSNLVSYRTLEEDCKHINYGLSPDGTKDPNFDLSGPALNQVNEQPPPSNQPRSTQDYYRPKEYDPNNTVNPLEKPIDGSLFTQIVWTIVYPIHFFCIYTMPDCRSEKYRNWYPFTFFVSMIWISFYSYFMVWMITVIGTTLHIPDTVMGLTFVAAGVSVPDALSSIAVIKEGYGDMAVSNAVGSNVFDILVCLGLPWFVKTAIIKPGSEVKVISKGLTYSTLSLLSTVVFLITATHYNGWKLDRRLGIMLMIWYGVFIIVAIMYETDVFGVFNPATCPSLY